MSSSPSVDEHQPSLLLLDSFCLVHISQFLSSSRDLASLQLTCKTFYVLLQASGVWAQVLRLNYGGFQVQSMPSFGPTDSSSRPAATDPSRLSNNKELCKLLKESAQDSSPVRFVALYTDGGVDAENPYYWADHAFIPNSWAPFCAKFSDNVNVLAILKIGRDAAGELHHRRMMIDCLKWVLPLLQLNHIPMDPDTHPVHPRQLDEAVEVLSSWKTQRLENFFCQMAARAAAGDPLGQSMLRGLHAAIEAANAAREQRPVDPVKALEERLAAARVLGFDIQMRPWYNRAYQLRFIPSAQQRQCNPLAGDTAGPGRGLGMGRSAPIAQAAFGQATNAAEATGRRVEVPPYENTRVLDMMALRSELMTPAAASSVAILHGFAVSREGRLSCPVQSGALIAGLLPQDWPHGAMAKIGFSMPHQSELSDASYVYSCDAMIQDLLDQPSVTSLNDKLDADSVFAACASGQLPPWVRHVVMEHVEYIELLPKHLVEALRGKHVDHGHMSAAANSSCLGSSEAASNGPVVYQRNGGVGDLHPVLWFRFTEHTEYSHRRLSHRARTLLRHVAELCRDAADLLEGAADHVLDGLRAEITAWLGPSPLAVAAIESQAGGWGGARVQGSAGISATTLADDSVPGIDGRQASGSTGMLVAAAPSRTAPLLVSGRASRPESLSQALHRAIRLAERLTSLGTAANVLAPELHDAAGFSLPDSEVHGLQEQANTMMSTLSSVARKLGSLEKLIRFADAETLSLDIPLGSVRMLSEGDEDAHKDGEYEEVSSEEGNLEEDGTEDINTATGNSEDEEEEDNDIEEVDEVVGAAAGSSQGSLFYRRSEEGPCLTTADATAEGNIGDRRPRSGEGRGTDRNHGLEELWNTLECNVLGTAGRQRRLALAGALRRQQAAAAAAAVVQTNRSQMVERRNEEMLQRLPVSVPSTSQLLASAASAAAPSTSSPNNCIPGESASNSDGTSVQRDIHLPPDGSAGPVLIPPIPDGWAAERLFDPYLQHDVDSGRVVLPEADEDGHRVVHLAAQLLFPVAANAVVFKAIRPENLMAMVGWDENEQPNVDLQYIALQGRVIKLPPGLQAVHGW